MFNGLRVTVFVSVWNNLLTFLSFSGCLCLPLSFWFILSPLSVSPSPSPSLSVRKCNVPQNRQHQFCQPTKVALASANWTDLLWVSLVAVGCLCGKDTGVDHCWVSILQILLENVILPKWHHICLATSVMMIQLPQRDTLSPVCMLKNTFKLFWIPLILTVWS